MDLNEELDKYKISGFEAVAQEIQQKKKDLEDKYYILCVLNKADRLDEKINVGHFPENSFMTLVSLHDWDIGHIVKITVSDNIPQYNSQGNHTKEYEILDELFENFVICDEQLVNFPEKTRHTISLNSSASEQIKNILLTPEMKSCLLNTKLQSELSEGKKLRMKKI